MNSTGQDNFSRVRAAARQLRDRTVGDPLARSARLEEPIPIHTDSGEIDSWFAALTVEDCLLGFLQLEPDLTLHRYSTFQKTPGTTQGCPTSASWLDPNTIRDRARTAAAATDQLGEPTLSYQGNRDRVAWRVPITNSRASIYVAGQHAYKHP